MPPTPTLLTPEQGTGFGSPAQWRDDHGFRPSGECRSTRGGSRRLQSSNQLDSLPSFSKNSQQESPRRTDQNACATREYRHKEEQHREKTSTDSPAEVAARVSADAGRSGSPKEPPPLQTTYSTRKEASSHVLADAGFQDLSGVSAPVVLLRNSLAAFSIRQQAVRLELSQSLSIRMGAPQFAPQSSYASLLVAKHRWRVNQGLRERSTT
jgi:hypothetical protein